MWYSEEKRVFLLAGIAARSEQSDVGAFAGVAAKS